MKLKYYSKNKCSKVETISYTSENIFQNISGDYDLSINKKQIHSKHKKTPKTRKIINETQANEAIAGKGNIRLFWSPLECLKSGLRIKTNVQRIKTNIQIYVDIKSFQDTFKSPGL